MKIITDERCTEYSSPGHPERPARITGTLEKLRSQKDLTLTWAAPLPVNDEQLECAHTREHIAHVKTAKEAFDGDTAAHPNIFQHAQRSVGGALQALTSAKKGELAFSLLRPPGHHATRTQAMGFCYFNSIAVAAYEALTIGYSSVAVFDFDVHHGNGTEDILKNRPHMAFYSIHQHPCYPGTGTENVGNNCFNYPVAPHTPRADYRKTIEKAMSDMAKFKPKLIAVSAGFDAYAHDPLAQGTLEVEDYHAIGKSLRDLGIPVMSILEGGYSNDLPELIFAYLRGLSGK